uniref:C2H2-type domain-containing protein n=1 Tax=Echeneis naucrates TaxID=173247 RepID=A0A665T8N4_ECHNA
MTLARVGKINLTLKLRKNRRHLSAQSAQVSFHLSLSSPDMLPCFMLQSYSSAHAVTHHSLMKNLLRGIEELTSIHGFDQKYPCPDCTKVANTISELEIHRTCHDQNRPYVCKLCDQRFWTRPSLCNHYREDHPEDAFTCHFCNKAYSVKKSLARHIRKWHQNERKDVAKSLQEKSSTEQSSSQVSMTGESGEEENDATEDSDSDSAPYFPCHVCGKTFPTSESLEDHQRCHLGEKPHECEECGRCFFQASQLQQHQRMHKSEFQCQACGRGFVSLFFIIHQRIHTGERPFKCPECGKGFSKNSNLNLHLKTHKKSNIYQKCPFCKIKFSCSEYASHMKMHAQELEALQPWSWKVKIK